MKVVVIISANAEWRVVKELYPNLEIQHSPYGEFANLTFDFRPLTLFHGGWGKISAAATAQYVIDYFQPDLLINLGTCGGFAGRIETGTIMLVERTLVYDIIEQMGDGAEAIEHYATDIDLSWLDNGRLTVDDGQSSIVRGLLVSADRDIVVEDIPMLIEKYDAVAADWESGAIAWVAKRNHTRLLILRGVTDLVGGDGGEAYGKIEIFHERTKTVMRELFRQLPEWLEKINGSPVFGGIKSQG
ncbi:MAG: 5'-methylthioadenosine/S-adenosylhomocysteine nucleosidase [Chloroflexi bacterium]|nr:5'-methylthioadenosine/S-adenosylhomocysteine nucleosidase [Chloroflexota bacterium]